ncbi:hypothetical protein H8959_014128 [Pygathrix nigripes]
MVTAVPARDMDSDACTHRCTFQKVKSARVPTPMVTTSSHTQGIFLTKENLHPRAHCTSHRCCQLPASSTPQPTPPVAETPTHEPTAHLIDDFDSCGLKRLQAQCRNSRTAFHQAPHTSTRPPLGGLAGVVGWGRRPGDHAALAFPGAPNTLCGPNSGAPGPLGGTPGGRRGLVTSHTRRIPDARARRRPRLRFPGSRAACPLPAGGGARKRRAGPANPAAPGRSGAGAWGAAGGLRRAAHSFPRGGGGGARRLSSERRKPERRAGCRAGGACG